DERFPRPKPEPALLIDEPLTFKHYAREEVEPRLFPWSLFGLSMLPEKTVPATVSVHAGCWTKVQTIIAPSCFVDYCPVCRTDVSPDQVVRRVHWESGPARVRAGSRLLFGTIGA